jgi:hypothetical protein
VRRLATARRTSLLLAAAAVAALAACTEDEQRADEKEPPPPVADAPAVGDAGPVHVHALGINPADGALFIATHTGLFREPRLGAEPERVAGRFQDTMGFTVIGADRFLASGHPDGREKLPPFLGLIESTDAGESWKEISLQGEMDFHVLEAAGRRVYGFGSDWKSRTQRLLVSEDRGESWRERRAPEPLIDLAVDPRYPDTAVAAGRGNLHLPRDAGRRWRTVSGDPGLLTWLGRRLSMVTPGGVVHVARGDRALRWQALGQVGNEPARSGVRWPPAALRGAPRRHDQALHRRRTLMARGSRAEYSRHQAERPRYKGAGPDPRGAAVRRRPRRPLLASGSSAARPARSSRDQVGAASPRSRRAGKAAGENVLEGARCAGPDRRLPPRPEGWPCPARTGAASFRTELLARADARVGRQPKRAEYGRPLKFGEGMICALVEGDPSVQVGLARRAPSCSPPASKPNAVTIATAAAPPTMMTRPRTDPGPHGPRDRPPSRA